MFLEGNYGFNSVICSGGSVGEAVKLLAYVARSPGFEPGSLHYYIRDGYLLLPSPDITDILLERPKFSERPDQSTI